MMALLPLAAPRRARHYRYMDAYSSPSVPSQRASWVLSFARRVHDTVSEMNYASNRLLELTLCCSLAESDQAPDTYAEFLLRTSAVSVHEPSARRRGAGRPVK
jgi:hypothetical protein